MNVPSSARPASRSEAWWIAIEYGSKLSLAPDASAYLIGSVVTGDYRPGPSDVDTVVYGAPELNFTEADEAWQIGPGLDRSVSLSVCERPMSHLQDPLAELRAAATGGSLRSWKELTAIEDALMVCGHGVLLAGREIDLAAVLPAPDQVRRYYVVRSMLLSRIQDRSGAPSRPRSPRGLAKSVVRHAKELIYLWCGQAEYQTARMRELVAALDPPREVLGVLDHAIAVHAGRPVPDERLFHADHNLFFAACADFDRRLQPAGPHLPAAPIATPGDVSARLFDVTAAELEALEGR